MQSKYTVETIGDEFYEVFDTENKQTVFASDSKAVSHYVCMAMNCNGNIDHELLQLEGV